MKTPLPFLPEYKNPCFKDQYGKIYCLPYVFILASQKSGTNNLYTKLVHHPMVSRNKKEFHWWNRARFVRYQTLSKMTMLQCMNWYKKSTIKMSRSIVKQNGDDYHPMIFSDGTASLLYDQLQWHKISQNSNTTRPCIISAHVIKHVLPQVKFLVILRNLTNRLYSDYTYYKQSFASSEKFHELVEQGTQWFKDCLAGKVQLNGSFLYDLP